MNIRHSVCALLIACIVMAAAPGAAAAPAPAPVRVGCTTYIVQPGDNLFRISLRYNVTMAAIMQANGLTNPNYIYVGQVLCIPTGPSTSPPAPPPPAPIPPAPAPSTPITGERYCVQAGDTLAAIAARSGTTVYAIMQANCLTNPNYIYVGQCLVIPGKAAPKPAPSPAPAAGNWKGEYYNNPSLAGSPALVRYDAAINFDWGGGSPSPRIPVDNFSVRWSRTVYLTAAQYRFTLTVDDGARLWVDDQLLIDQWGPHAASTYAHDANLGAGYHSIRLEYQELTGGAMAALGWVRVAPGSGGAPGGAPGVAWLGEYFDHIDIGGSPEVQRLDPAITFDWGLDSPFPGQLHSDFFSVRWTRSVQFEGGTYRFYAQVDDGVRIYVDNRVVLNEWHDSSGVVHFNDANVSAGVHTVKVEYYEHAYDAMISVWWEKLP